MLDWFKILFQAHMKILKRYKIKKKKDTFYFINKFL